MGMDKKILDAMVYVSEDEATTPKHLKTAIVDQWWIVHPEKGLTFYNNRRSGQFNDWEPGVQKWCKNFPGHIVKQFPVVYI